MIRIQVIPGSDAAPLVDPFYELEGQSHRACSSDLYFVAFKENAVVGVCRFCIEENTPLLRSMVVHTPLRSQKIGANILKNFANYLDQNNFKPTYCIPYGHLGSFYGLIDFNIIKEEESPAFLQDRIKQYRKNNPDTFMIMRRD